MGTDSVRCYRSQLGNSTTDKPNYNRFHITFHRAVPKLVPKLRISSLNWEIGREFATNFTPNLRTSEIRTRTSPKLIYNNLVCQYDTLHFVDVVFHLVDFVSATARQFSSVNKFLTGYWERLC